MKTVGLLKVLLVVVPMVVMLRYPFIKDAAVTSVTIDEGRLIVTGTVKVMFTDEAWKEFGYKNGNFEYFEEWWRDEAPGMTWKHFRLVSADWDLDQHTDKYDVLSFTMVLELNAHAHGKGH